MRSQLARSGSRSGSGSGSAHMLNGWSWADLIGWSHQQCRRRMPRIRLSEMQYESGLKLTDHVHDQAYLLQFNKTARELIAASLTSELLKNY